MSLNLTSCVITGRPARSAAMPVLFLLSGPKIGFSPRRGDSCPHKREIGTGEQARSPMPNLTFIGTEMWEYSPPNCQNFEFWP